MDDLTRKQIMPEQLGCASSVRRTWTNRTWSISKGRLPGWALLSEVTIKQFLH